MQNIQLIKQLEKKAEMHNDFTRNNNVLEGSNFYKSQVAKYNEEIVNLCRQIESLHTNENKPIL
jgi:hypothetical protein